MAPEASVFTDENLKILEQCGFPSFDDFCKDPDKWRKRPDELFSSIDNGSQTVLRQCQRRNTYEFEGHRVDTIEQLERILRDEGLTEDTVTWSPQVIMLDGDWSGRFDILHVIKRKAMKVPA